MIGDAILADWPIMIAVGPLAYLANWRNVARPIPSVAPMKTPMSPGGRAWSDWLEILISLRLTIAIDCLNMFVDWIMRREKEGSRSLKQLFNFTQELLTTKHVTGIC